MARTNGTVKDSNTEAGRQLTEEQEHPATVRLSVNLAWDVADTLKHLSKKQGLNVTHGVRKAIILWKLVSDETEKGNRVMVVSGEGEKATYREILLV